MKRIHTLATRIDGLIRLCCLLFMAHSVSQLVCLLEYIFLSLAGASWTIGFYSELTVAYI
jgi:hypothetical protein